MTMSKHEQSFRVANGLAVGPYAPPTAQEVIDLAEAYLELLALLSQLRDFSFSIEQLPLVPKTKR